MVGFCLLAEARPVALWRVRTCLGRGADVKARIEIFVFRDSYVLCIYVMNILCTFHVAISWLCNIWNIITGEKNVFLMIIFNAKGSGLTRMKLCSLFQSWSFMEEKLFCVYCGITAVLIQFEFWNHNQTLNADIFSQQPQHVHENFLRNIPHSSIRETLRLSMITQGHIQQESRRENIWFRLVYSTRSTIFTRSCIKWFPSFSLSIICSEWQEKVSWAGNQLNFTWEEATNYLMNSKKW